MVKLIKKNNKVTTFTYFPSGNTFKSTCKHTAVYNYFIPVYNNFKLSPISIHFNRGCFNINYLLNVRTDKVSLCKTSKMFEMTVQSLGPSPQIEFFTIVICKVKKKISIAYGKNAIQLAFNHWDFVLLTIDVIFIFSIYLFIIFFIEALSQIYCGGIFSLLGLKRACTTYRKVVRWTEYRRICTGWFFGRRCRVYAFTRYTRVRRKTCNGDI